MSSLDAAPTHRDLFFLVPQVQLEKDQPFHLFVAEVGDHKQAIEAHAFDGVKKVLLDSHSMNLRWFLNMVGLDASIVELQDGKHKERHIDSALFSIQTNAERKAALLGALRN